MIRPAPPPAPKVKPLEQQKTDFTAEGSPPPGVVGPPVPVPAHKKPNPIPRSTGPVPGILRRPPWAKDPEAKQP